MRVSWVQWGDTHRHVLKVLLMMVSVIEKGILWGKICIIMGVWGKLREVLRQVSILWTWR